MPGARLLLRERQRIAIGSRAFDLLVVLLKSRGNLVTTAELVRAIWPGTVVAESNLRFQVACLRSVLRSDRDVIKTIPGRGYLLAAEDAADSSDSGPPGGPLRSMPSTESESLNGGTCHEQEPRVPVIVVIDDDLATREALEGLVRSAGWRVELFASVGAFMDFKRDSPPHCLILDVWMPGRSGLEFQADLAKTGLTVPVIFISGHADVPMSVRAMKAGAIEFLTKPVRHEDLLEAIGRAVVLAANTPSRRLYGTGGEAL